MKSYEQAVDEGYLVPWKTIDCVFGSKCWCKEIVLVDPIKYIHIGQENEHKTIIDSAILDKKMAEYIVDLHNEKIISK